LKDKNGKLIFEGDIVKITCELQGLCSHVATVSVAFVNYHWSCSNGKGKSLFNYVSLDADFEIIGNIHDNAEN